jgi:hypothetical protein
LESSRGAMHFQNVSRKPPVLEVLNQYQFSIHHGGRIGTSLLILVICSRLAISVHSTSSHHEVCDSLVPGGDKSVCESIDSRIYW